MQHHESLTLCWCSFSECHSDCVAFSFSYKGSQFVGYAYQWANHCPNTLLTWPKINDPPLTHIEGGRGIVTNNITNIGSQYFNYGSMLLHSPWIMQDARPWIVDAALTLIFRRWKRLCCFRFCQQRLPIYWLCITESKSMPKYLTY